MLIFLKLLLAVIVAAAAWAYYSVVLPTVLAGIVALLLAVVLVVAALTDRIPWRVLIAGGPVIAAWPAGALLAEWAAAAVGASLRESLALGASWWLPLLVHKIEAAVAEKRDRARDVGGFAIAAICVYLVGSLSLWERDFAAVAVAALGVALAALATREHLLIGPESRAVLAVVAGVAGAGALLLTARALLA